MGSSNGRAVVHKRKKRGVNRKMQQLVACVAEDAAEPSLNAKGAQSSSQNLCLVSVGTSATPLVMTQAPICVAQTSVPPATPTGCVGTPAPVTAPVVPGAPALC